MDTIYLNKMGKLSLIWVQLHNEGNLIKYTICSQSKSLYLEFLNTFLEKYWKEKVIFNSSSQFPTEIKTYITTL